MAETFSKEYIADCLRLKDRAAIEQLFTDAYKVKLAHVGNAVYFRGIIELSNRCRKDCLYCGIRRSNAKPRRYSMSREEILTAAKWALSRGFGSIVLQSGERNDEGFVSFIEGVIRDIREMSGGRLGMTLSLGEQNEETYARWFRAGGHRYLLRIETSSRDLYCKIHPADHSYAERVNCLRVLKKLGYQLGTGVMIGLPFQTYDDLAADVEFFREIDVDMIGMGPFIAHADTPLGAATVATSDLTGRSATVAPSDLTIPVAAERLDLALKMIAVTRLYLRDINIAATTALQALSPIGRELGLKAGANIIMPILTETKYRGDYKLYDNKPCLDDSAEVCQACLERRIKSVGHVIGYGQWGDSPHALRQRSSR